MSYATSATALEPVPASIAARIRDALLGLLPYEPALLRWIAASGTNARLFMRDPLQAAAQANLGLPEALLTELRTVSHLLGRSTLH